jgi:LPPG:FO 2-phospho-L-lactate transferase
VTARVLALCGGVGGAKLALGLYRALPPDALAILVNTGDDFEHLGLHVSPDVDTVLYTLSGKVDRERGWGRSHESWRFMDAARELGLEDWFLLGDQDIALHVARTQALRSGATLGKFTAGIAKRLGVTADIWPMSDQPVRTFVDTDRGWLAFQRYFVGERAAPAIRSIEYLGAAQARPAAPALALLASDALEAVILCPSNPWLSMAPLLAMPELRSALERCDAPIVAVSPIIAGTAVKGPTAKIMLELGLPVTAAVVAEHYRDLIDGYVLDRSDAALASTLPMPTICTQTLMRSDADRLQLAHATLEFARRLGQA